MWKSLVWLFTPSYGRVYLVFAVLFFLSKAFLPPRSGKSTATVRSSSTLVTSPSTPRPTAPWQGLEIIR